MDNKYQGKKVLIFGLGVNQGGLGAARFFAKQGAIVRVTDLKPKEELVVSIDALKEFPQIEYALGGHSEADIDWADLIIKNPGVKPGNHFIEYALSENKKIETDMGIFLEFVSPSMVIGITGTKGKSTTSSLIYEVLKAAGKQVVYAGNIGKSVLDTLEFVTPQTLVVLEISSFQLEGWQAHGVSPKWAVITNILPDHLNYYKTMDDYIAAKRSIAINQTNDDYLFLHQGDPVTTLDSFLVDLRAQVHHFGAQDLPADFKPKLLGQHNLENCAAALAVTRSFGIADSQTLPVLANFAGVEFRIQLIKEWQGVKIYNDSAATGPSAGIEALKSLPDSILIAGGVNKNLPYEDYAKAIDEYAKMVFFLEGDATETIIDLVKNKDKTTRVYNNLHDCLKDIKDICVPGDKILFSPAAASFNLFQNEFDRGRKFNEEVAQIFQ